MRQMKNAPDTEIQASY